MSQGESRLRPCPPTPNCVCSNDTRAGHRIAPLQIEGPTEAAWQALIETVEATPRLTIVTREDSFLAVEARTRLLGFVDDVAFELDAGKRVIGMRSASRVGLSDLGTNRRRLEALRSTLQGRGVVARESP